LNGSCPGVYHQIDLTVEYSISRGSIKPMMFIETDERRRRGSGLGKRNTNGHGIGLIQVDADETSVRLG